MINDMSTNRVVPDNNTRYAPNWILIFFFSIIGNWDSPSESICEMYCHLSMAIGYSRKIN